MPGDKKFFRSCFQHLYGIERKRIPPIPKTHWRLHRLEKPTQFSYSMRNDISNIVSHMDINYYPDYAAFKTKLCSFFNLDENKVVLGAGIEDFIRSLMILTCDPGDTVTFTHPTCAMFNVYASVFGLKTHKILPEPDYPLSAEHFAALIPEESKLVILPNPGQPVESYYPEYEMEIIAERCRDIGAILAIDEAYIGFGAVTCLPLLDDFENVLILRTFSKAFGAASIRLGFAVGNELALQPLEAIRESGEVSGPSMMIAGYLMDNYITAVSPSVESIIIGRDYLRSKLIEAGYTAYGELANHVLLDCGSVDRMEYIYNKLEKNGIHVKGKFPWPVRDHLLITAAHKSMMEKVFDVITEKI